MRRSAFRGAARAGMTGAAALVFLTPAARAQGGGSNLVITPAHIRMVLSALADDSMEGRASGTRGSMRAARFIAAQFKAAGIAPAGDSGYFQHVPMAVR